MVDAVLSADLPGRAERDDAALLGAQTQGGDRRCDGVVRVVEGGPFDQEDGERGTRRDRVDYLGVQDLLSEGEPGVRRVGEGAYHLEARRRQVEQAVEGSKVQPQVSDLRR